MTEHKTFTVLGGVVHRVVVVLGAVAMTVAFFLLLPLIQAISQGPQTDVVVRGMESAELPPPPPPPIDEEPPEEEELEEEPPKLEENTQPLDLSQIELALNPGAGGGWMSGGLTLDIKGVLGADGDGGSTFGLNDLDQKPRALHRPQPILTGKMRSKRPGKVVVIFVVNEDGRVENERIESSTDSVFEKAALKAVRQWKFEPGKRNGKAVSFNMRCPLTF